MKPKFDVKPMIGIGSVNLDADRTSAIESMGLESEYFMKTPLSRHPTDSFYDAGFQIFYEGELPKVESIELSRGCEFDAMLSGCNILELPITEALNKIEGITGFKPKTEDGGYSYEIPKLGLWVWRQSNDPNEEEGLYFSTIGIGKVNI